MAVGEQDIARLRDEVASTMRRVYRRGLTTISGGNTSARDRQGRVWVTPAALPKSVVTHDDIVCVDPDGSNVSIYRARDDVHAVVHAHSAALVAYSLCHAAPDLDALPAALALCGPVGTVPYELTGSTRLGEAVAAAFAGGADCVVLDNHGVVVAGATLAQAFARLETLEFAARTLVVARRLGDIQASPPPPPSPERPPAGDRTSSCPPEREIARRHELCALLRHLYDRGLSATGRLDVSMRLAETSFLQTPPGADPETLSPADLRQSGAPGLPDGAHAHAAVYETHGELEVVVRAAPVCATAFGLVAQAMQSRTIPESYWLLRDPPRLPTGAMHVHPETLAETVTLEQPAALIAHEGVVVVGRTALEALDRLEVIEATARSLALASSVGTVVPLTDDAVEELRALSEAQSSSD
ncbi:MAG: class II aldolase/adducin family protein [Planctomycetota bacterium]|jgi:L-fuculose-phosphate aldolase